MSQIRVSGKKKLPLSLRISFWLIGVAIIPLLVALLVVELQSRSTLIDQSSTAMEINANNQTQTIDNYLKNKMLIFQSLDNSPIVQQYFADPVGDQANLPLIIQSGLSIHELVDPEVLVVSFFTPQGKLLTSYSQYKQQPFMHGNSLIPSEYLAKFTQSTQFISGVYYSSTHQQAYIDIYTPVYSVAQKRVLGVSRESMSLENIWNTVKSQQNGHGPGSYAFILDENGVRIADPVAKSLFTSIAPLPANVQANIEGQNLYGENGNVPVLSDTAFQITQTSSGTFQGVPNGQSQTFQIAHQKLSLVPWTYYSLIPVNVILAVSNQQLLVLSLIALLVIISAAVIGWVVGNSISSPILRLVWFLTRNSATLNELAEKKANVASEQVRVVDASKVSLNSVLYYTKASKRAIWRLNDIGKELLVKRNQSLQSRMQDVSMMMDIGHYLEKTIDYQDESNKNVDRAIKVTDEVAEQLVSGARSAKEVANELDQVVKQLRQIIGNS
jgi:hypothetical protein